MRGSHPAAAATDPGPGPDFPPAHASRLESGVVGRELIEALRGCARRDPAAFARLYDLSSARVFGLVLRVVADRGHAEDVTQEVYLELWRSAGHYDPAKGSAWAWIITLAHRRAVDRVRAETARTHRDTSYHAATLTRGFDVVADTIDRHLDHQTVRGHLAALTPLQREAITLAYFGHRTYPQVAAALGISVPTAKSRIRDGLARLKTHLTEPRPTPANPVRPRPHRTAAATGSKGDRGRTKPDT
ncbi:ECF RNA polymerase sigma factor SigK [Nocardia sp. NPDC004068]|uniref:ECF RNA polymerase sigma factor SigK n=1 Tax=Nocardia sp. NPDC004068 TaxID=3364303 RepID=UPI00368A7796